MYQKSKDNRIFVRIRSKKGDPGVYSPVVISFSLLLGGPRFDLGT